MVLNRKGVSPIIATILLVAIVVVLAIIIFLWARGFVAEKAQKFDRAIEISCPDVVFESGIFLNNGEYLIDIVNRGNVPIYGLSIKKITRGSVEIKEIFQNTIGNGESASFSLGTNFQEGENILVVPVILGETSGGKVAYTCPDENGYLTEV